MPVYRLAPTFSLVPTHRQAVVWTCYGPFHISIYYLLVGARKMENTEIHTSKHRSAVISHDWVSEWRSEWVCERANKWVNGRVSLWLHMSCHFRSFIPNNGYLFKRRFHILIHSLTHSLARSLIHSLTHSTWLAYHDLLSPNTATPAPTPQQSIPQKNLYALKLATSHTMF